MTEVGKKHLLARVKVTTSDSLEVLAARLSQLMPGFNFEEELTGRYEEVPAFVAESYGMRFVLFGPPEGERKDAFGLEFGCRTSLSIEALLDGDAGAFARQFVHEKPLEDGLFMDFSEELAQLLVQRGIVGCEPILLAS